MGSYEGFAAVYDMFMDEVDYDQWLTYLKEIWHRENFFPDSILDLGCGTGSMTIRLAQAGYDMTGVDNSSEMLSQAEQKALENHLDSILFLLQDMREFELYGTVSCVVCLCDSLNYILEEEELTEVFRLVNNYLDPGGLFIFDMNTEYKFKSLLGDGTYAVTEEHAAYIWENTFDEEEGINEYHVNFFVENQERGGYDRFEEYHYERAYEIKMVEAALSKGGLELLHIYDSYSFDAPKPESERIFFIAREQGKKHMK